ncbi:MAG: hypothetical protein RIQ41_158 [Candidatus Parcubacteria bacterium]|jgi:hypothetical protein
MLPTLGCTFMRFHRHALGNMSMIVVSAVTTPQYHMEPLKTSQSADLSLGEMCGEVH